LITATAASAQFERNYR